MEDGDLTAGGEENESMRTRIGALERAVVALTGEHEPDEDEIRAIYFGGDPFPLQRLVLTSEIPDISGGHMLGFLHEIQAEDGEWILAPATPAYALGIEAPQEVEP